MNVHKEHPRKSGDLLAPGWSVEIVEIGQQQIAIIKFKHIEACRLSLAASKADPEGARRTLIEKTRRWIWDYQNR